MLDRPLVPHVHFAGHPETILCDAVAADCTARDQAHWALRGGEVLVVDGKAVKALKM